MKNLRVGCIYKFKESGDVVRVLRHGGAGWISVRGCTRAMATPSNYCRPEQFGNASELEINNFLEKEMESGMTWQANYSKSAESEKSLRNDLEKVLKESIETHSKWKLLDLKDVVEDVVNALQYRLK